MTPVTLLDPGYWHLSQFIVYGGGGMLWRLPGQSTPRTADPPPARLVTQPPTGTAAAATNPHSGKTNASHAQLMMGGLPFLSTFLWFYELLHSLFASVISLSWGLCRCPSAQRALVATDQAQLHMSHYLSQIQIIQHAVATFAYAESRINGTYI